MNELLADPLVVSVLQGPLAWMLIVTVPVSVVVIMCAEKRSTKNIIYLLGIASIWLAFLNLHLMDPQDITALNTLCVVYISALGGIVLLLVFGFIVAALYSIVMHDVRLNRKYKGDPKGLKKHRLAERLDCAKDDERTAKKECADIEKEIANLTKSHTVSDTSRPAT